MTALERGNDVNLLDRDGVRLAYERAGRDRVCC